MKYISLFTGIGGADLGFDRAGMECVGQVEIDGKCGYVLNRHWSDTNKFKDVRNVGATNLGTVDVICGGFPCQDVSVAGKRGGLAGERSGLWYEFRRIIAEVQPRWVVIENVPGLLSSNGGRDMGAIIGGLADCGYRWGYRVLDSQYFGVPQRRRRVFIVGCLAGFGRSPAEVLFEREGSPWDVAPSREAGERGTAIAGTLSANAGGTNRPAGNANELDFCIPTAFGGGGIGSVDVATTCNASGQRYDFESETFIDECLTPWDAEAKRIHSSSGKGGQRMPYVTQSAEMLGTVRRLTPIECARLQGFPDDWNEWGIDDSGNRIEISDTQRYRQMGNAVTVPVAEYIGRRILEADST